MLAIASRVLIFLAIVYVGIVLIVYLRQDRFIFPAPQDVPVLAPGYEAVELETSDGLTLTAHWREPDRGRPTIMHFHGNAGNSGSPSEEGFWNDGRAGMAFLEAQGVAPESLIVKGHSIGSGTATNIAGEFGPAALILLAPFTSIKDRIGEAMPILPVGALIRTEFDNASKLPALKMPVLVQHGTQDRVIPEAHGKALGQSGPHVAYQSFEGSGHELTFEARVQEAQLAWLEEKGLAELNPAPDAGGDTP